MDKISFLLSLSLANESAAQMAFPLARRPSCEVALRIRPPYVPALCWPGAAVRRANSALLQQDAENAAPLETTAA